MNKQEIDELRAHYDRSMELAHEWGLAPFEVDFHVVPPDKMYEVASYGIPGHFSHWTYGRDYWRQKTSYDYGHSKIYELVINADPAQAFLLENNSLLENMFVVSHVIGHSDFFANNAYFSHTDRRMIDSVSGAADRVREYELEFGRYVVEDFIDKILSIREHVDPHLRTTKKTKTYEKADDADIFEDLFPEIKEEREIQEFMDEDQRTNQFPYEPERDILLFLANHGRLTDWQRDVILAIRDESLYFLPQMQTKIMNEGWASIIHRRMMHEIDPAPDPGGFDFAQMHSGVLSGQPGNINPYWLGFNIYERIIDRWDNPSEKDQEQFGAMPGGEGWERALEVRAIDNDETFIRNYLDEKICEDLDLFSYGFNSKDRQWEVTDVTWELVRDDLAASKVNMGMPFIQVVDGDYKRRGELYLVHDYDGRPLQVKYAQETLKIIAGLWGRPAHLKTQDKLYSATEEGELLVSELV